MIGYADGTTTIYSGMVRPPIIPGSARITVTLPNAVDRLAAIDPASALMYLAEQAHGTGVLREGTTGAGGYRNHAVVNYQTGQWTLHCDRWMPPAGGIFEIHYRRELHVLHGAQVQVMLPDGSTQWIDLKTLCRAIGLA